MMFPYVKYKTLEGRLERLPIVSVRLACNRKHQQIWALIDSGADISVFNASVAMLLDVDIRRGRPLDLTGLVGGDISAWVHQVNITVEDVGSVDTVVAFTELEDTPGVCILGQKGFFDNFQIRFQRYKDQIELYPKSTSV